jgi:hypothetical protein
VTRTVRNLLLALLLIVVVIVAGRTHLFRTTPTTTTSTTVVSTTTTTASTSSTTTTTSASLTTCRGSGFTGSNVGSEGAAGTGYDVITLTKVSAGTCVVDGYPLITLQGAHGVVESSFSFSDSTNFPAAPANAGASAHTVNTGDAIDIQFRYSDVPTGTQVCPSIVQVNVQFVAGDTSVPVSVPYPISPCPGGPIGVSAFYPA